jgi:hypothetical protein
VTYQAARPSVPTSADPGREAAQLRRILALVEEIAGETPSAPEDEALDEAARIGAAYADALPIAQRRFDMLAAETSAWAATGVEVLIALEERELPSRAAAAELADALARALGALRETVSA